MELYPEKSVARKAILAAWLGWLMDGYVSIAYVIQGATFIGLFFPTGLGLLYYVFFVFSGGIRAVGSALLGNYIGDRLGRKKMMVLTIGIFSASGAAIGLLPTYSQVGILSPILLGILLVIMGLFAGAEYGGGTALSMETIPPEKRNFIGAFVQGGFGTGYAILAIAYFFLSRDLTSAQYLSYGWRILFLSTGLVGLITLLVRRITRESKVFEETVRKGEVERSPIVKFIVEQWKGILVMLTITGSLLFVNTATFSLYPTILGTEVDGFTGATVGASLILINVLSVVGVILGGLIASKSRRKMPYMLGYSIIFLVTTTVISSTVFTGDFETVTISLIVQAFFEGMIFSTLPAFMAEIFSKRFRTTGVGLVYNMGSTLGVTAFLIIPYYSRYVYTWNSVWPVSVIIAGAVLVLGILMAWRGFEREMESKDMIVK